MVCAVMGLWLHDQMLQSAHAVTHTCTVGWMYQSPQCDQLAVLCRELIDPTLNGVSVRVYACVRAIESLLISYGCPLLGSIAVSLHKVVLTACAI